MTTMNAIVQDRYGPPDVLRLDQVARPTPNNNEVLIRVHAASVNARDWHTMRGDPYIARLMAKEWGLTAPKVKILGTDFAGTVEAVGANVTHHKPGDEVYGEALNAFAEYVCAPETVVAPKPTNLTFEQAAAVPLAANTALMALRDVAKIKPRHQVLINGASGGVGTFAVQIARELGAEVTAVCGTRNVELVRSLGAHHVVDYRRQDFTTTGDHYDVILDLVGNRSLTDCRRALTPAGTLVLSGGGVSNGGSLVGPVALIIRGQLLSRFIRHRLAVINATPSRDNLTALTDLLEAGAVTPVVDRTYPLDQVPDAIRYLEVDHARAKVVIKVG